MHFQTWLLRHKEFCNNSNMRQGGLWMKTQRAYWEVGT